MAHLHPRCSNFLRILLVERLRTSKLCSVQRKMFVLITLFIIFQPLSSRVYPEAAVTCALILFLNLYKINYELSTRYDFRERFCLRGKQVCCIGSLHVCLEWNCNSVKVQESVTP